MTRGEGGSIDEVSLEAGIGYTGENGRSINSRGAEDGSATQSAGLIAPGVATTVSAGLYVIDFISNVFVLKAYWDYYQNGNYLGYKDLAAADFASKPFFSCLALMICGHVGTVIAFKLKLPPEQNPLTSAYFLPLIQFRRFVKGLIGTGSCAGYSGPSEPLDIEAEALYAMVSAAIDTGPQVALQFLVVVVVSRRVGTRSIPLTLQVSIIASFLSGSYNTGRAVMFKLSRRWSVILNHVGVLAGLYTGGALLLRTVTITVVMGPFWSDSSLFPRDSSLFPRDSTYINMLIGGSYLVGLICEPAGRRLLTWSGQLHAIVSGYVTGTLGPLYPVVDRYSQRLEQDQTSPPNDNMKYRLGLAAGLNLLLDVVPLVASRITDRDPCTYQLHTGEWITETGGCRNFLKSLIIVGISLSVLVTLFLIYLLHSVQRQECAAAICDDPPTADSKSRAPDLNEDNQECLSAHPAERLVEIISDEEKSLSQQPSSCFNGIASFGSKRER